MPWLRTEDPESGRREGTGRLYRILVYEQQLAQSVRAYQSGQGFSGTFEIAVTLRTGADQAAVMGSRPRRRTNTLR